MNENLKTITIFLTILLIISMGLFFYNEEYRKPVKYKECVESCTKSCIKYSEKDKTSLFGSVCIEYSDKTPCINICINKYK